MIFRKSLFRGLCRTSRTGRTRLRQGYGGQAGRTIAEDRSWREITGFLPGISPSLRFTRICPSSLSGPSGPLIAVSHSVSHN